MKLLVLGAVCLLPLSLLSSCRSADANAERISSLPCRVVLAPGDSSREIGRLQQDIRLGKNPSINLERLGWAFVEKASQTSDQGYFKLAEQCAECLLQREAEMRSSALLLRGHALHNLHRFHEAESLARELADSRGNPFDFGLLGDTLLEQGKLDEAAVAYQKMMDMKPGPYAYARAAQLRWMLGDIDGAKDMARQAARSAGGNDYQTGWVLTRLALLELQTGNLKNARTVADAAVSGAPGYAPAALAQGRVLYASGNREGALVALRHAVAINPLPEYLWWLADVLREAGHESEALEAEQKLLSSGSQLDPRTLSLFLSTHNRDAAQALSLGEAEITQRGDVFTYDALAFAQFAAGRKEASSTIEHALAHGTQDGRLYLHAALIARRDGNMERFRRFQARALSQRHTLLPSELALLTQPGESLASRIKEN